MRKYILAGTKSTKLFFDKREDKDHNTINLAGHICRIDEVSFSHNLKESRWLFKE